METAGEGGAWGIGILAAYMLARSGGAGTLQEYLDGVIFADIKAVSLAPDAEDVAGFEKFMTAFRNGLER